MINNNHIFALLVAVGDYRKLRLNNLASYKMDLLLIGSAIINGLKVPKDNVRLMAGECNSGKVTASDFTKAINEYRHMLSEEDTLILYFSGHGVSGKLLFSDVGVTLKSVLDFLTKFPVKNKLLLLDCCYSGSFERLKANQLIWTNSLEKYNGRGLAVMASSAKDEASRLGPGGNHSMFTGAVSTVISIRRKVRKGRVSLSDIFDETRALVNIWNQENPGKEQHIILRNNISGTVYFNVEEYHDYKPKSLSFESGTYTVVEVKPMSTLSIKRLCAFIMLKEIVSISELPSITKQIVERIRNEEIYSTAVSEAYFKGKPVEAVWCYFGYDMTDMINHLYVAHTIWAESLSLQKKYYETGRESSIVGDINLNVNKSYTFLKKITAPVQSRKTFIEENKRLLYEIILLAENFFIDLEEVANGTLSYSLVRKNYQPWVNKIKELYLRLSDLDVAPIDLHEWSEEILTLAGWILDLALMIENSEQTLTSRKAWLFKDTVRKYNESLDKVAKLENKVSDI